jgi:hypothetical protein
MLLILLNQDISLGEEAWHACILSQPSWRQRNGACLP